MAGLDFKGNIAKETEDEAIVTYNTRVGVILFFIYVLFYAGFMLLSAFWPEIMSSPSLGGVNLAVVYGFVLIGAALLIALLYLKLCKVNPTPSQTSSNKK